MKKNQQICDFIQHLYEKYPVDNGKIGYGFNEHTNTFIVRIDDDSFSSNEGLLSDISVFSSKLADEGEWVIFVFPSDVLGFSDFEPIEKFVSVTAQNVLSDFLNTYKLNAYQDHVWSTSSLVKKTESGQEEACVQTDDPYVLAA